MSRPLETSLFPLGQLFITSHAQQVLDQVDVLRCLERHALGDWGELDLEDKRANDHAVKKDTRILSAYWDRNKNRFWIITEADRSVTTVLLPEDY